jgi:hypothetical protein
LPVALVTSQDFDRNVSQFASALAAIRANTDVVAGADLGQLVPAGAAVRERVANEAAYMHAAVPLLDTTAVGLAEEFSQLGPRPESDRRTVLVRLANFVRGLSRYQALLQMARDLDYDEGDGTGMAPLVPRARESRALDLALPEAPRFTGQADPRQVMEHQEYVERWVELLEGERRQRDALIAASSSEEVDARTRRVLVARWAETESSFVADAATCRMLLGVPATGIAIEGLRARYEAAIRDLD